MVVEIINREMGRQTMGYTRVDDAIRAALDLVEQFPEEGCPIIYRIGMRYGIASTPPRCADLICWVDGEKLQAFV